MCVYVCVFCGSSVLARLKQSKSDSESRASKSASELGTASYVTSVFGIVVATVILFAVLVAYKPVSRLFEYREGTVGTHPHFHISPRKNIFLITAGTDLDPHLINIFMPSPLGRWH